MNDSATSLDRLHDIVMPEPVAWWPPAAGWYVVIAAIVCGLGILGYHLWITWRSNAYRREALRELATAGDAREIAEILRRVALVIAPRDVIAMQTGERWPHWLASRCAEPIPPGVHDQLAMGVYRAIGNEGDTQSLRTYAAHWISQHQQERVFPQENPSETVD
ncbi:MAG: DUF4381 domain-containing protein [Pirellulaceae bacterium]